MMQDVVACCNGNDINVLHRFLSVIEGICSKLEIVPDNDIVIMPFWFDSKDRQRRDSLHRRPQQIPL